ncbi:MAG TPA: hypothetical protein VM754_03130 [Actinomycetota bacterium]|nr:hypothetical protein [Actinomycetota bacterium]
MPVWAFAADCEALRLYFLWTVRSPNTADKGSAQKSTRRDLLPVPGTARE